MSTFHMVSYGFITYMSLATGEGKPFFPKVFEKVVYNKILDFISDLNVCYDHQYGFRKSRSTQHAIITLVGRITKSQDMGDIVIVILIDLRKAFDTVDQSILLRKLYA